MNRSTLLLLTALLLVLLCGCALLPGSETPEEPVEWNLSPDAQETYHYLLLEDAKSAQNATIAQYALERLLTTSPSPQLYMEAANLYWQSGDMDKAGEILEQGLVEYPDNEQLLLVLAQVHYANKNFGPSAEVLKRYLDQEPEDYDTFHDLADIFIQDNKFTEALDILKAIPNSKRTSVTRFYLSRAYTGLKKYNQAIRELKTILKENPELVEAWAELAFVYELKQDFAAAERTYTKIMSFGESSQDLWLRLLELNLKLDKPDKALSLARKGPDTLSFALTASNMFMEKGYHSQAELVLKPLVSGDDTPSEVYFYLAVIYYEGKQDIEQAIRYLEKIPPENQYYDRSLRFRIHLVYETGRADEALKLADEARNLFADQKDFWLLEARLLDDQEQYDKATDVLLKGLEIWNEDAELLYVLGVVYDKADKKNDALAAMERVIVTDPEHAEALNYVGYTLADESRDLGRAMDLVRKALGLKPDSGYIIDSMAWVLFRQAEFAQAWEAIKKAVEIVDDDPIIWEHYGDIAASVGNTEEARKGYAHSLEKGPDNPDQIKKKLNDL